MAEISKIKVGNTEYNIKDEQARQTLANKPNTTDFTNAIEVVDFTHVFVQTAAGVRRISKAALISAIMGDDTYIIKDVTE